MFTLIKKTKNFTEMWGFFDTGLHPANHGTISDSFETIQPLIWLLYVINKNSSFECNL